MQRWVRVVGRDIKMVVDDEVSEHILQVQDVEYKGDYRLWIK